MTGKKLADNEIIKALKCCGRESCFGCPYRGKCHQGNPMIKDALDLITRQQTEILRLKSMNQAKLDTIHDLQVEIEQWKEEANKYQNLWCMAVDDIEKAKSEAVKEFAERLCEDRVSNDPVVIAAKCLLKEMVGDDNA